MKSTSAILAAICVSGVSAGTMGGTGVSTLNTVVAGATPTSIAITLTPPTVVADTEKITCTYTQDVFTGVYPLTLTCAASPASAGIVCKATSAKIVEFTAAAATFAAATATSFAVTSGLGANFATGAVGVSCVSTADTVALVVDPSFTTTAAPTAMTGTAASTLNTLVAGATPTSNAIALTPTTIVPSGGKITCTYDQDVFAAVAAVTCAASPASAGIACAATSTKIVEFTAATATFPAASTSFAMTSNLAANFATGAVGVSCVSTQDVTAKANAASFTTTSATTTSVPTAAPVTSAPTAAPVTGAPVAASSATMTAYTAATACAVATAMYIVA